MTTEKIIEGSKLIAKYMGLVYIPFSTDMKHGKGGYYEVRDATPNMQEVTQTIYKVGEEDKVVVTKFNMDTSKLRYTSKNGWTLINGFYYKYVCRTHGDLCYWNSLNELIPVIQKIEKETKATFYLYNNGCSVGWGIYLDNLIDEISSFDLPNWSHNVFSVVVCFLSRGNENK